MTASDLPEVLDLLVVGGGPGGTATAFRARELGLAVLVVDYDDVLKRIRDYSKDKLILPNFGGGDALRFPQCGEMVGRLHFRPIDKDEMHLGWKALYGEHAVPVAVGLELTGLERCSDGWQARCWDHPGRAERSFTARHVALALGRGVPRRFDIPGNTDGIAFRLADPAHYVGSPALVLGGGTSAAEAVIAISHAKTAAGDATDVYWSYRGDKMPRVSKALADAFFAAYLGNGNIRYHPRSEPVAVVTGEDREEYLSLRVDRRTVAGRPSETAHLEFPKGSCVACIGEDLPESLLRNLGIAMVSTGPNRKQMLVNPLLETVQPNVYLVGDLLSQSYLETDDFAAPPERCREVKHRGNIKSALRDGVIVAEAVAARLAGGAPVRIEIVDAFEEAAPGPALGAAPVATEEAASAALSFPSTGAEADAVPAPPAPLPGGLRLVRLLPGGLDGEEVVLRRAIAMSLGRKGCDVNLPDDVAVAERHATVLAGAGGAVLRDEGSAGGVFLRARPGEALEVPAGGILRAGRQFLVLAGPAGSAGGCEVHHFDQQGVERGRHPLGKAARLFGREAPDVTLDAGDPSLSRRHLSLAVRQGKVWLKDLKSVNGTYLRITGAVELADGDEFRIGRQGFRLSVERTAGTGAMAAVSQAGRPVPPPAPARPAPAPPPAAAIPPIPPIPPVPPTPPIAAAAAGPPSVTFQGHGTFPVRPGETLCEVAEAQGLRLNAECHAGICGSDPIRILAGQEHLEPPDAGESDTLQDLCGLPAGPCRLACMVRVRGPVVVEIVRPPGG